MTGDKPTMVFDRDCGFCRRWIARWRKCTKGRVRYIPFQRLGSQLPEVSRENAKHAVQFRDADGRIYGGADGVARLFLHGMPGGRLAWLFFAHPPVIWALRLGYKIVARNRSFFSWLTRWRRRRRHRETKV